MAVLRLNRFTTAPVSSQERLTRHATLVAAVKDAFARLIEVQLAKASDQAWTGVRRGERLAGAARRGGERP